MLHDVIYTLVIFAVCFVVFLIVLIYAEYASTVRSSIEKLSKCQRQLNKLTEEVTKSQEEIRRIAIKTFRLNNPEGDDQIENRCKEICTEDSPERKSDEM